MTAITPTEQKVLQQLDGEAALSFLQALVRSDSQNPPGREKETALLLQSKLASLGLSCQLQQVEDQRYNILALLPGESEEQLLFNGHMDTVSIGTPDNWTVAPLGGEIIDGKLYGRGACDMKAGLAAMVYAIEAIVKSGVPRKKSILFTGVIDEEVYFKGTQALIDHKLLNNCTRAYVSEPTSLGAAASLQGACEFTAHIHGKAAHTGMAEIGVSAIYPMARFIAALEELHQQLQTKGKQLGFTVNPSINVGVVQGGHDVLLVPDHCLVHFDRQVFPGEDMSQAITQIETLFRQICNSHNVEGKITCNQHFNPWRSPDGHPVAQVLTDAHHKITGRDPQAILFRAYAEIEMLATLGIPGMLYGPGSILQAHRPDEFVRTEEVITAAKTYALIAYDFIQ